MVWLNYPLKDIHILTGTQSQLKELSLFLQAIKVNRRVILRQTKRLFVPSSHQERILSYGNGAQNQTCEANPRDPELLSPEQLCSCLLCTGLSPRSSLNEALCGGGKERTPETNSIWRSLTSFLYDLEQCILLSSFIVSHVVHLNSITLRRQKDYLLFLLTMVLFLIYTLKKSINIHGNLRKAC